MKNERAFSRQGFYRFVLDANLMLHQNVADAGKSILSDWLSSQTQSIASQPGKNYSILDLACGGAPVSICRMTESLPASFEYSGIDINPDQVESARNYTFPLNYKSIRIIEGNAWDFLPVAGGQKFDIIFSGMNLHHGIAEELFTLFAQVRQALNPGGLFLSHDFFRPHGEGYIQRPQEDPVSGESFLMISPERLAKADLSNVVQQHGAVTENDWRISFIDKYRRALAAKNAAPEGIEEIMAHVANRDYPFSIAEVQEIARLAGIPLKQVALHSEHEPMHGFFCMMASEV